MPKTRRKLVSANEAVTDLLAKLNKYEKALRSIATLYPEPKFRNQKLDEVYGINDGRARGITAKAAVNMAREALGLELD